MGRKYFIDNLRYGVVITVILFHIAYQFNTIGVARDVNIQGIPQLDLIEYIVYPWFMVFLFFIAGISARYALQRKSNKEFLKERVRKILIPSIAWVFLAGWSVCVVHNQYRDIFAGKGDLISWQIKYLICCKYGIGPTWFCHELFLASLLLVLIRKRDKNDLLWIYGGGVKFLHILLLFFLVWGSSHILNAPVMNVYRNGIYVHSFWDMQYSLMKMYRCC